MAVAIALRVGDTSARDISLTSSGVNVLNNYPLTTADIEQETIRTAGDGNSLGIPEWGNVTESIPLFVSGANAAAVADKLRSIERLLDLARQGSLGQRGGKVYLRVQFDHDAEAWRSQILAAKLEVEEASDQIWRNYARVTLVITRRYYFETEAMKSVAVSSGVTTTPTTGYATVYNAHDSNAINRNWFQVAANQVVGSIPAPAKISIKNISGSSKTAVTFFLGNYVYLNPTTIDPIFRGSEASASFTTPGTTEQTIYHWSLASNDLMDAFRGQLGRFVVVWSDRPAITTLVRAALLYRLPAPEANIALGEPMLFNPAVFVTDLGALPLPPSGYASGFGSNLYLHLMAKAASGTDALGVDWLHIFPTGAGRYRVLQSIFGNIGLSNNDEVVDDGPNEAVYALDTGGAKHPIYKPLHEPIYLWPGEVQRLRLLIGTGAWAMETAVPWGVKVEYRPRRLSF